MKKTLYETPLLSTLEIGVEHGFAASSESENWYDEPGKGYFTYETDTDETWG